MVSGGKETKTRATAHRVIEGAQTKSPGLGVGRVNRVNRTDWARSLHARGPGSSV